MRALLLVIAAMPAISAIKCYNNINLPVFNAMNWTEKIDLFFSSDFPLLDNFELTEQFVVDSPGANFSCLIGQAYPRGLDFVSTCLYFPIQSDFPPEALVLVNLLAGTCTTDRCNNDCNQTPSWSKGRKLNMSILLILCSFGIVLTGVVLLCLGNLFDRTPKDPAMVAPEPTKPEMQVSVRVDNPAAESDASSTKKNSASFTQVYSVASSRERCVFMGGCVCMAATGMAVPLMSWNFGRSIGALADSDIYSEMCKLCLVLVYLAAAQLVIGSIGYALLEPTSVRVAQRWREQYLTAVLRQDVGWFDINQGGGVLSKMAEDTATIQKGTGIQLGLFLMHSVSTVGALILAFAWAGYWRVALVCIAVVPLIVASSAIMLITNDRMSAFETTAYAKAGTISSEAISSIRTVQALNAQDSILTRFRSALVPAERASLISTIASGTAIGGMNASFMAMYLVAGLYIASIVANRFEEDNCNFDGFEELVQYLGGPAVDYPECMKAGREGENFVGDLLATLFNIAFAGMGLGQIGEPLAKISAARQAVATILEVVSRVPTIDASSDGGLKPASVEGTVELKDVTFAYPSRPDAIVATGLSLRIAAGEMAALVGPSGSGKSTVMALVQRYYDPLAGSVTLGGHDLKTLNVRYLRSKVGLVGQEPVLFAGSFHDNIMYGAPGNSASEADVVAAAKLANAHGFISTLESGYQTDVGAGGSKISGGQKQRIAIARAIIRKPKVLLLDEATSALDNESEKIVQAALSELRAKQKAAAETTTTIVIAHRLSTIADSDTIFVIKNGSLAEKGTHDELLGQDGVYQMLWKKQGPSAAEQSGSRHAKAPAADVAAAAKEAKVTSSTKTDAKESRKKRVSKEKQTEADEEAALAAAKKREKEEIAEMKKRAAEATGRIWDMQKGDRLYLAGGFFGSIANGLIFPVMAVTFAGMLFMLLNRSPRFMRNQSYVLAGFFAAIAGLLCVPSAMIQFYGFGKSGCRLTTRIRGMVFEKLLRTEIGYFDLPQNGAGEVTVRIGEAASNVKALTGEAFGRNVSMACMMLFGPFLAMSYSYQLVLSLFFVMPFLMIGQVVFLMIMQGQFGKDASEGRRSLNIMHEALTNIRTVVATQLEGKLIQWYAEEGAKGIAAFYNGLALYSVVFAASQGLQFLAWSFLFWFAALAQTDRYSMGVFIFIWAGLAAGGIAGFIAFTLVSKACAKQLGDKASAVGGAVGFLAFLGGAAATMSLTIINVAPDPVPGPNFYEVIFGLFVSVFSTFGMANAQIGMTDAEVAAKAVVSTFSFLDEKIIIDGMDATTGLKPDNLKGAIECVDISFSYPSRPHILVASGFNLSCPAGATVALVGQSGCGKSTTVLLLERFYDPSSGTISLDGYDLKTLNVRHLRRNIGLVGQEPILFAGSIFSNIAKGMHGDEPTKEEVEEVAKLANAHDFISTLQNGYQTDVGERGNQLSGGQKQRVAIARAIIAKPKVLLLDEATSALDNESEKIVQAALDELLVKQKRTTLVIAHRLSTVRNANKICFLADGKVAEQGTHDELYAKGGLYADMVSSAERL